MQLQLPVVPFAEPRLWQYILPGLFVPESEHLSAISQCAPKYLCAGRCWNRHGVIAGWRSNEHVVSAGHMTYPGLHEQRQPVSERPVAEPWLLQSMLLSPLRPMTQAAPLQ